MLKKLIMASVLFSLPLLAGESTGVVTKVIDGDTLNVMIDKKEEKIRILYIDTPAIYSSAKLEKDAKKMGISVNDTLGLGKLASDYASRFFKKGGSVLIDSEKKDQSGRMLATVSKNGVDYSNQIIEDGYACIYKKAAYPGELEKALKSAKDEKRGLWSINYDVMNKLCK